MTRAQRLDEPPLTLADAFERSGRTTAQIAADLDVSARHVFRLRACGLPTTSTRGRSRLMAWLWARGIDPRRVVGGRPMAEDDVTDDLARERRRRLRTAPPVATPTPDPDRQETPMETVPREYLTPDTLVHFGLAEDPFADAESPEDVFLPPRLQLVENALLKTIQRRQIIVLVGPPGAGKSTLLRRLYGRCGREKKVRLIAPASLDRSRITHAALSVAILRDLIGRETASSSMEGRSELLRRTLADQTDAGLFPALLIDEGHKLKVEALLALKQLWDSHTMFKQLAVIVIGQLPLKRTLLQNPDVRELTMRAQIVELGKMDAEEVGSYLNWRLARVGDRRGADVFAADAVAALCTRGEHPLAINNLAVRAMAYARSLGDRVVTATHVGRS